MYICISKQQNKKPLLQIYPLIFITDVFRAWI